MNGHFPELLDPATLPRRVLCVAPHPDDEVIGCGGTLALHAARGDQVRVLLATGTEERLAESRAAAGELGLAADAVTCLGFEDGRLGAAYDLVGRLRTELAEFAPELVYAPSAYEHHPDHLALHRAMRAALPEGVDMLCYGVNSGVSTPLPAGPVGVLVDVTAQVAAKRAALRRFETQLGTPDAGDELIEKVEACDRGRTINVDRAEVKAAEGFVRVRRPVEAEETGETGAAAEAEPDSFATTAVISNWNKRDDLRENLDGLRSQTRPFARIVVVDNASDDGSPEMVAAEYPEVHLVRMPHSRFGACETFNIGFKAAETPLIAILDDDVVLPPEWLERTVERLRAEPETTAIVSTEVVEPGMPEGFLNSPEVARERYMSTFRGCASLARADALRKAEWYDERLFIYGNERDLTCRLLNLGYRVLHFPAVRAFHKTPYGIKMGKRSLYYHARNAWLTMLKYAPLGDLVRLPWLVVSKVLLRKESDEKGGQVTDAVGTIGIGRSVRETPGAWWVLVKAGLSVLANVPYCLARRRPCGRPTSSCRCPDEARPVSAPTPSSQPAVTAVVCNYEGEGHLPHCLPALLAQTYPLAELIVVDNGSTDRSLEVVRELAPEARIVAMDTNAGPGPARNRGVEESGTELVLMVDNDAVLEPDCLAKLVAAWTARDGRDLAFVQPRSLFAADPERVHYDGASLHYAGLFSLRNFGRPLASAEGQGTVPVDGAISVALLTSRTVMRELGGFDPRYFILFEDLDLSYRARMEGLAVLSVEDARVHHRSGTAGISFRDESKKAIYPSRRVFLHSRNRWVFLLKNYRLMTLLVAGPGLLFYELVWFAFALKSGHPLAWLRGKWAFLTGLGTTLEARSRIQARRRLTDRELLVGGPLTIHAQLEKSSSLVGLIDRMLTLWWTLVRRLAG